MKPDSVLGKLPPQEGKPDTLRRISAAITAHSKHLRAAEAKAKLSEIKKLAKTLEAMGKKITGVSVAGSGFTIMAGDTPAAGEPAASNPWDEVLHG